MILLEVVASMACCGGPTTPSPRHVPPPRRRACSGGTGAAGRDIYDAESSSVASTARRSARRPPPTYATEHEQSEQSRAELTQHSLGRRPAPSARQRPEISPERLFTQIFWIRPPRDRSLRVEEGVAVRVFGHRLSFGRIEPVRPPKRPAGHAMARRRQLRATCSDGLRDECR